MSIFGELGEYGQQWITLYELDLSQYGIIEPLRLHAGVNEKYDDVVWNGKTYTAYPIEVDGFEVSSKQAARPTIKVANVTDVFTAGVKTYDDFLGCKFRRIRTLVKYIDAANFSSGVNPTADPSQHLPIDEYFIAQKTAENKYVVEFELASAFDLAGAKIPKRQVISNLCAFKYRGEECGYTGGVKVDAFDNPTTDPSRDGCSKTVKGCKLHFGEYSPLRFGGFVGSDTIRTN